jgi:SAM-dependent methyltransferase
VIEHVPAPAEYIRKVRDLLRPDGVFIAETPNHGSIFRRFSKKKWIGYNPYHIALFSPGAMNHLLKNNEMFIHSMATKNNSLFSSDGFTRMQFHRYFCKFMELPIVKIAGKFISFLVDYGIKRMLWGDQLCVFAKKV